jgi:hypothetical protein
MRKPSDATKLRHAKREIGELKRAVSALSQEIALLRSVGGGMSNICFNLSQDKNIEERHRESMNRCRIEWDAIRRALR